MIYFSSYVSGLGTTEEARDPGDPGDLGVSEISVDGLVTEVPDTNWNAPRRSPAAGPVLEN